ncbi:hypothetical protein AAZX31_04G020000 [Glycine max]|uniref:Syringolide-induced protein 14-1-1 n=2 Tax=Glycine subgen. Soja TaxID=1462606 RepID=Q8S901_SOYBN|nr:syringolide-induced protein 14-1-1 [Glycine max]XP_028227427.1 uncharacterized protein At1g76070-like [Glycine soja]ACU19824.1 unknown [Glycine max]KAG5033773.1 hypothetical protein JHK87_008683 [Glycine soja]KAH1109389.1 hypothetical protein GYH30_008675 [Glycine max]KAH1252232.1 Uncharacterized protein GmHk_04G009259 [Glycine max]KHN45960.1 Hypothetical protein glysoja_023183 [Glycine soja]|eukprot:NP_001237090.1 syringolide-induced protein 14-1-1 [Glycine max]
MKSKILKALPKAVAAVTVTFQNHPFSPGRDHKSKPIVSMIPHEARRKTHDRGNNGIDEIYSQEPTSPKISCMGQIKHKKKQIKKSKSKSKSMTKEARNVASKKTSSASRDIEVKKHVSTFHKMLLFHGAKPKSEGRKSNASAPGDINKDLALADAARAPRVSQMRRFSSGRDALAEFDWKVSPDEEEIDYYSDEYRVDSDGEEEEEIIIPFSAPLLVGGGVGHTRGGVLNLKPRKEINLWKRRTMAPPRPLQLDRAN